MKILKRLVYVLLMIPICTIVFVIESSLLPLIILAIWVITGSTILRVKVTKGCKSFYVCTITQIVYYRMNKYLTKSSWTKALKDYVSSKNQEDGVDAKFPDIDELIKELASDEFIEKKINDVLGDNNEDNRKEK